MNWFLICFKKYADFSGRARRTEYWTYSILSYFILVFFIGLFFLGKNIGILLFCTYYLLSIIPGFAVKVRRLHDVGFSGWWCLIMMMPIIGFFFLLILLIQDGHEGKNKYGDSPKGVNKNDLLPESKLVSN
ncbi:DUF805 domain-containing protein [Yersinia ruckeri]|uniref:DUF805 domain-containing protein n=2 Tax=Yersinia ruckeri TaxID=29486 RepID=UPI0020BE5868|nr:DUF805 domain-containing protein [Yersinia ruckeri]